MVAGWRQGIGRKESCSLRSVSISLVYPLAFHNSSCLSCVCHMHLRSEIRAETLLAMGRTVWSNIEQCKLQARQFPNFYSVCVTGVYFEVQLGFKRKLSLFSEKICGILNNLDGKPFNFQYWLGVQEWNMIVSCVQHQLAYEFEIWRKSQTWIYFQKPLLFSHMCRIRSIFITGLAKCILQG